MAEFSLDCIFSLANIHVSDPFPWPKSLMMLGVMVLEIVPSRKSVVTCKDSDSIIDAFNLLIKNKILSVPVIDAKTGQPHAFIDAIDIVTHVSDILLEGEMKEGFDKEIAQIEFGRYTCGQLAGYSQRDAYKTIKDTTTIRDALEKFHGATDQHRFAVVDSSSKVLSILSQSQLVRALLPYIQTTDLAAKTVGELRLGYKPVLSIGVSAPASQAFKKMQAGKVTGLAVLDADSKLVGSISASDLKEIGSDASLFERVLLPVGEFWAETLKKPKRRDSRATSPTSRQRQVYFVTPTDTVATVFDKFSSTRVHRLFVVDDTSKPLGVISLSDIIDQIYKFVASTEQH